MNTQSKITEYLSAGGLFNPELMEHEKVRDLLIDCRERISHADKLANLLREVEDQFTETGSLNLDLGSQIQATLAAYEAAQ